MIPANRTGAGAAAASAPAPHGGYAEGVVFHDRNGSGLRDDGDPGVSGVRVSNGRDVTVSDDAGRWRLPLIGERTVFFVIKPSGWRTPLGAHNLPQFHYIHDPQGSPELRYDGIAPTGELPESIDFPLEPQDDSGAVRVLMCGDPQPRDAREIGYLAQSAIPGLAAVPAHFGVTLGDIVSYDLDLFEPVNQAFALTGLPWRNLVGNRDLNFDAAGNENAADTFLRVYGPTYYAFEHGAVHFMVLNNVEWMGAPPGGGRGAYRGRFGGRQLEFIRNELARVPRDKLSVIMMHIPLASPDTDDERNNTVDREEFFRAVQGRPNLLTVSAHRHWHGHFFYGEAEGWRGEKPLHHIIMGVLCGDSFRGAPDDRGVPVAMMTDGTPRGYAVFTFDGPEYHINGWKAIGRSPSEQIHIEAPNVVSRDALMDTMIYANIYNGSERSTARYRVGGDGRWRGMERAIEPDPRYVRLYERDQDAGPPYRPPSSPRNCWHLWRALLPADLPEGAHIIEIESVDMFGAIHRRKRPVRVAR